MVWTDSAGSALRFAVRIDPWWRPVMLLIGATRRSAYVRLDRASLTVRLGLFRLSVPRQSIVAARPVSGRWWYGIGVHTDFLGGVAYNGSLAGVVELRLEPPVRWRTLLLPLVCRRLYVSLEDPDALIRALGLPA